MQIPENFHEGGNSPARRDGLLPPLAQLIFLRGASVKLSFMLLNTKNCFLKCLIFQINEENFTFVTFKTDDSIKWKLMYSIISFWGEILLFKPNKGHQINNQCERLTFFSSPVFKKNRYNNNAYKNISSALCPHSLLVVSIISDGSQELVAISLAISGSWAPDATYVQDRSQLFFFLPEGVIQRGDGPNKAGGTSI